jgi:hypothetical protein
MRNGLMTLFVAAASLCVLCNGSCDGGPTCKPYVVPAGTDLMSPTVSFKNDVLPVFQQSCAFMTCHGSMSAANMGVYLGEPNKGATMTATVISGLMKPSLLLATMAYVTPGNPGQSFLMRKMDGDQCSLDMKCTSGSCGASMPQGDAVLPAASRDIVRRWIAQGAKDN